MSSPKTIFVSYSHTDLPLVVPLVSLLRASSLLVFRDGDSIGLGKRWRNEVLAAIAEANLVVVFWCLHASTSDEVVKEYTEAISRGKDVLPLLLDETPLHPPLQEFQWLDFREAMGETHASLASAPHTPPSESRSTPRYTKAYLFRVGLILIVLVLIALSTLDVSYIHWDYQLPDPPSTSWSPALWIGDERLLWISGIIVLGAAAWAAGKFLSQFWRRLAISRLPSPPPPMPPSRATSKAESLMAEAIEAEILRRTAAGPTI